jgi:hypothetical protein
MPINTEYYGERIGAPGSRRLILLGNPDLEIPQTIAYELGYDQDLLGEVLLHVAGYYKDVSDQTGDIGVHGRYGEIDYTTYSSQNYADIFGIELRIDKHYGKYFFGWFNYNWVKTTSGFIGLENVYEDPRILTQRQGAQQFQAVTRPSVRLGLDFHTPMELGQLWGGWALNFLFNWRAGNKFTWEPPDPELRNNMQWVDWSNTDMRVTKRFSVLGIRPEAYLIVNNLFNQKYLNRAAFIDSEWQEYLQSLKLPWYEGELKGDDRVGIFPEDGKNEHVNTDVTVLNAWSMFFWPRSYYLGLRFYF